MIRIVKIAIAYISLSFSAALADEKYVLHLFDMGLQLEWAARQVDVRHSADGEVSLLALYEKGGVVSIVTDATERFSPCRAGVLMMQAKPNLVPEEKPVPLMVECKRSLVDEFSKRMKKGGVKYRGCSLPHADIKLCLVARQGEKSVVYPGKRRSDRSVSGGNKHAFC